MYQPHRSVISEGSQQGVNPLQEIETGSFAPSRWFFCPPSALRVVNWNVNRGLKLQGIVDFLAATNADLILLQEVDLNARRTHRLNIAREIAKHLKMNYVFAREFQELTQGSNASPAFHGQATLSRWPLLSSRIIRFQRQSHFWDPHWFLPEIEPFQERIGGRLALVNQIQIAPQTLVSYNLHLESRANDDLRCSQLRETLDDVARCRFDLPIVLAGDLNLEVPRTAASGLFAGAQFRDVFQNDHSPTTPPHSLFQRQRVIDWIFTRGPIHATTPTVHSSISASDHYPLSVVFALP
jgi:endonuclease/exonuclease/phosphatase family metal-dependent hydrolase